MSLDARQIEEQNIQRRARILGLQYADTSQIQQKIIYKELLSNQELLNFRVVPIIADAHNITFGITNNTSQSTLTQLKQRFQDQRISFVLISDTGYGDYMRLYNPPKKVEYNEISITSSDRDTLVEKVSRTLEQVRADDMLAYLVHQAHKLTASDIHLENQRENIRVRIRIDGVLHPIANISKQKYHTLLSAIASSGNVSTATDQPQQGHISQHIKMADGNEVDVNVRLETIPTINGMDVVMRLFNLSPELYRLDRLGLSPSERKVVDNIISHPSGLVLVVGPTGSGKTTTLYSMLSSLNSTERKIITVEDPVEYQFPGITQIPVMTKSGQDVDFANKLRAILRLDPDIVMVGEIRDLDTAKTALQASLTGHLVLSTFHASSASAALTRLMDVIGQNPLFVSAIRLVMAQRLARRLDNKTKIAYKPDQETLARIKAVVESMSPKLPRPDLSNLTLYKPGTSDENPYGFRGQVAVREQFIMSGEIRKLLENPSHILSTQDIEAAAISSGMRTMLQEGVLRVVAGQTTLDEIYRVVDSL